jgi:hypothetical protein
MTDKALENPTEHALDHIKIKISSHTLHFLELRNRCTPRVGHNVDIRHFRNLLLLPQHLFSVLPSLIYLFIISLVRQLPCTNSTRL